MKICDMCVTPISSPPYYECAPCNYFVHSVCYLLPKTLSSSESQLYGNCPETSKNHNFTLYTSQYSSECYVCYHFTSGMVYECEEDNCEMSIDVKCACLPTTIRHASHPHHKLIKKVIEEVQASRHICRSCGSFMYGSIGYRCTGDDCDFTLCSICILLPQSVMERELEKHPLTLTYDACIDHPSDFYCGICEEQIRPQNWMYHCRPSDNSFHPRCLETRSGNYKNIKLGRPVDLNGLHLHTLTLSYITLTKRCNVCDKDVYQELGFMCSPCYYVACLECGEKELAESNM